MPELSRFFGIAIYLNHDDAKQHHKPHFHARYGEHEASIPLDGILLAGSLPPKQMKLVVAWAALHETEASRKTGIWPKRTATASGSSPCTKEAS